MAFTELKITFHQDLELNEVVNFRRKFDNGNFSGNWEVISETWKPIRTGPGECPIATNGVPGELSAENFKKCINLDFPFIVLENSIFGVRRTRNTVSIILPCYWSFDLNNLPNTNSSNVSIQINNCNLSTFYISNTELIEAVDNSPCTHYGVKITTSELATQYTVNNNTTVTDNTENPISFEIPRGQGYIFKCQNANGQVANAGITIFEAPRPFNSAIINLQISGSPFGATVVAINPTGQFEYSINGVDYQSSNTFSGLDNGDYTMYVKDPLGCIKTKDFNINTNTIVEPEFHISKSMSLRFSKVVDYDNCGPYQTDKDSMSCREFAKDKRLTYQEIQRFQSCDVITTQFKSNFSNISAKVAKPDGTADNLIINKKTNFIGRKDARSAWRYNMNGGKTGIYFTVGNIYDYDTGIDTGEDYALNGGLPEWGRVGEYISIGSAWHQIVNVVFDEYKNAEVLVIDTNTVGSAPQSIIVKCQFNRQEYEVYEFVTNLALYNGMDIQVQIFNEDPNFESIIVASELINVKEVQKNTVEIIYWNNNNTDVFYKTGIKNKVRLPIVDIIGDHTGSSESSTSDTSSSLNEASVFELDEFVFEPMSKGMYRKIVQMLMHKFVIINGVGYHAQDIPEKEGPLGNSNLYQVKAKMIKTGNQYGINIAGADPEIITTGNTLEVPNLTITDNGNFISYD